MPTTLDCLLLRDLFGTDAMREVFDSRAMVQGWLDAEAALARAEASLGVIPADAAPAIVEACRAELYDLDELRRGIAESQHPLVPLIRALAVQAGEAGGWVHWGATTQDVIDTGLVLQLRQALRLLVADVDRALGSLADLAEAQASTPMAGRTHAQHAVPITFGLKAASWIDELLHARALLVDLQAALPGSLAGAAGTLASLGDRAGEVLEAFCADLGLRVPEVPWHAARYPVRALAHALSELAAVSERIAAEVARLQATEIEELREPAMPGHVGSSTMPQKRNPMTSEYLIGSARLLRGVLGAVRESPAHAGERDMGLWSTEWIAVPSACILASGIADKLAWIADGLEVRTAEMARNLGLTQGAIMAEALMMRLGEEVGHETAHELLHDAARRADRDRTSLAAALAASGGVPADAVSLLDEPARYVGWSADVARAAATRARAAVTE